MDQLKDGWAWFRKHHFWVFSVAVFGASIAVWYMGTDQMESETKQRVSKLENIQREQQQIRGRFQPNDTVITQMKKKNIEVSYDIWVAWGTLYKNQYETFEWPRGMGGVADELNTGLPIGRQVPSLDRRYLEAYRDELKQPNEVNRLKAILQLREAKEPAEEDAGAVGELARVRGEGGGLNGPEKPAVEYTGLVDFPGFYSLFQFPWVDRPQPPSAGEMLITQEDLWVYESMFKALAKVNADVEKDNGKDAHLKQIQQLQIGRTAFGKSMSLSSDSGLLKHLHALAGAAAPTAAVAAGGAFGEGGGAFGEGGSPYPGPPGMEGFGPAGGEAYPGMGEGSERIVGAGTGMEGYPAPPGTPGAMGAAPPGTAQPGATPVAAINPLEIGRYCTLEGQAVPNAEIEKVKNEPYKLIPLHLMVVVDQRHLPALLGSLANANLPVRIRQVQMYRASSTPSATPGGSEGGTRGPRPDGEDSAEITKSTFDVGVDIRGVIHVYNPPKHEAVPHYMEYRAKLEEERRNALPPSGPGAPTGTPASLPGGTSPRTTVPSPGVPAAAGS